jgi:hypothetical protein
MYQKIRSRYRFPVATHVELWFNDRPLFICLGRNLSVEGMLLEVTDTILPIGDQIMLQLHTKNRVWSIPSKVVHSNANCMGIMFLEPQSELYRFYVDLEPDLRSVNERYFPARDKVWTRYRRCPAMTQGK